jgi:hypothetical protein
MSSTKAPQTSASAPTLPGGAPAGSTVVRPQFSTASPIVQRALRQAQAGADYTAARNLQNRQIITAPPRQVVESAQAVSSATTMFLVPVLPKGTRDDIRKAYAFRLASSLVGEPKITDRQAAVVIIALFHILYEDTAGLSDGKEWKQRVLTPEEIAKITVFIADTRMIPAPSSATFVPYLRNYNRKHDISDLPSVGEVAATFCVGPLDWLMFHGYAGLLLFSMHKDAGGSGEDALRVARPQALCAKYNKDETTYPLWTDEGIPGVAGYVACAAAWKIVPMTREYLMRSFARIANSPSVADQEALFLSVRLMAWTDLAHIPIITLALNNFPNLELCPRLRSDYIAYTTGIAQMTESMPYIKDKSNAYERDENGKMIRDTTTLPYLKAMFGDKKSFAQRNTMPLLLCVAKHMLLPIMPSLRNYNEPTGYSGEVADVVDWHDDLLTKVQEFEITG